MPGISVGHTHPLPQNECRFRSQQKARSFLGSARFQNRDVDGFRGKNPEFQNRGVDEINCGEQQVKILLINVQGLAPADRSSYA